MIVDNAQPKVVHFKLPIPLTKFLDPLPLDANTFLAQFAAINGAPMEVKEV